MRWWRGLGGVGVEWIGLRTFKGNIQRKGSFKGWGSFIGLGGGGNWRTKVSFILVRGRIKEMSWLWINESLMWWGIGLEWLGIGEREREKGGVGEGGRGDEWIWGGGDEWGCGGGVWGVLGVLGVFITDS